jgi:hypothetical protein
LTLYTDTHSGERAPGVDGRTRRSRLLDGLLATLPAWAIGHALIIAVSWYLGRRHPLGKLFSWDTFWYLMIARSGYDRAGGLIHFFPLTSLAARALATVTRLPTSIALFTFCWAMALLFGALIHRLVMRETGDRVAAARAAWLSQLVPGAYALVMGYTEPLAGVLAVGYFLAIRSVNTSGRRTGSAVVLGFFGGMARPVGVLLAIPGAIEGLRAAREQAWSRAALARATAIALAPITGLAAFLGYSRARYGSWMLPYTQQTSALGRGAVMQNPFTVARHVWTHNWRGHGHPVVVMSGVLIVCFAALLPLVARRLPVSYAAWTVPSFVLAIGSKDFTSLPRYLGALFPCLIALALTVRREARWRWHWRVTWQWAAVLCASCALLLWTTYYVFMGYVVA